MPESSKPQQNQATDLVRVVIIDDHPHIRELVRRYLVRYFGDITTIVGEADRVKSAISLLQTTETDIIFLDIDLTDGLGFEAIDTLSKEQRERTVIIIITMERERVYVKQAIEYRAIAFLDKPLVATEFKTAVGKAVEEIGRLRRIDIHINALQSSPKKRQIPTTQDRIIEVRVMRQSQVKTYRFTVSEVVFAQSARNYCVIGTADGLSFMPSLPLKHYQDTLIDDGCVRISRGTIVNPVHIKFRFAADHETIAAALPNGEEIAVEQQFCDTVLEYM